MAITDIFSTSLLISLAICLLLVGSVFMYFNQKIADQNHKITSMFDLVSTMAEEVNSVKYHVQMVAGRVGIPMGMNLPQQTQQVQQTQPPVMNGGISQYKPNDNLITISEDEDSDDEDDDSDNEDDSEDEDDDDDEDDEDDEDDGEDDDSEEDDDEEDNESSEDNDKQDIKIDEDEDLDIEDFDNLNFESVADLSPTEDSTLNESDIKNLKKININVSSNDNENEEEIEIESEDVSDINIKNVEVLDYKKLSLNKLRSIVTEKGVVTDASKLKKHELLKLLEVE
jgi:hypothetical protein